MLININYLSPTSSPKLNVISPYVFLDALVEAATNLALQDAVVKCTNKITEVQFLFLPNLQDYQDFLGRSLSAPNL